MSIDVEDSVKYGMRYDENLFLTSTIRELKS